MEKDNQEELEPFQANDNLTIEHRPMAYQVAMFFPVEWSRFIDSCILHRKTLKYQPNETFEEGEN